jgi:enoyl-CoA hydratase/carnithine racemase
MSYDDLSTIRIERGGGVVWATIDAPPMNLLGGPLFTDLGTLTQALGQDPAARVLVLRSANPDFFIAHGDVETIVSVPEKTGPLTEALPFTHQILEGLRNLPVVSIAQIEGFARGGGSEVSLACDMRFGALGKAVFGQPEVAMGILPGAGGTARLTRMLGRARACEIVLGCDDFSAEEAEQIGWINRALPANEIGSYVDALARRIATFPALALAEAKGVISAAATGDMEGALLLEQQAFDRLMADPASERVPRMRRFLNLGCQTPEGEPTLGRDCTKLAP